MCTVCSVEGALKEVKRALLDADVNLKVTNRLVEGVKSKAVGMKLVDGELRMVMCGDGGVCWWWWWWLLFFFVCWPSCGGGLWLVMMVLFMTEICVGLVVFAVGLVEVGV